MVFSQIQELIQPMIETTLVQTRDHAKANNITWTLYDDEFFRLSIVSDMYKALGKYIKRSDVLVSLSSNINSKGIEIRIIINRDNQQHFLDTQYIYAGGYNIQRFHIRYIINTSIPKIPNEFTDTLDGIKNKKKIISKIMKAEAEVLRLEKNINSRLNDLAILETKSLDQVWEDSTYSTWVWSPDSSIKTETEFIEWMKEIKAETISKHYSWINKYRNDIGYVTKSLVKAQKKLEWLKR